MTDNGILFDHCHIGMTGKPITSTCYAGCKKKNERPSLKFLICQLDYIGGRSPSDLRNRVIASSTPCDMLANSFSSTIFSRNSIDSGVNVTVKEILVFPAIRGNILCKELNIDEINPCLTRINLVRVDTNENNRANRRSLRLQKRTLGNSESHDNEGIDRCAKSTSGVHGNEVRRRGQIISPIRGDLNGESKENAGTQAHDRRVHLHGWRLCKGSDRKSNDQLSDLGRCGTLRGQVQGQRDFARADVETHRESILYRGCVA